MRYSLITQITLIGLSIVIFLTVIKPMFASISAIQDERLVYEDAVEKAQQFNMKLDELLAIRDSFREDDIKKLDTFLPSKIDTMQVMRDIEAFFQVADIELVSITQQETTAGDEAFVYIDEYGQEQVSTETRLDYQDVTVTFAGTYDQLKKILELAERNNTLLEVTKLTFGAIAVDGEPQSETIQNDNPDNFNFSLTFRVYGLAKPAPIVTELNS